GVLGGVIPILGQEPPLVDTGNVAVEETIVVTASLKEEARNSLPSTVDVIGSEEIEARQSTFVAGLIGTLPGMTVVRSGSSGAVTSLFTRGTNSNQTLVLWNGIELNDPYFGGFNWAFLPTDGVERIEAVRGPFSSLYGADALGGVVQVLSGGLDGASLRLEAGENNYRRGGLSAGTLIGQVRLDVAGHLRLGEGEVENDFYDGEDFMVRADWDLRSDMSIGILARAADSDTGIPFSGGQLSPNRKIFWQERQVGIPFRFESGRWRVDASLAGVFYDNRYEDPDDPFGFTSSERDSKVWRGRVVASYRLQPSAWIALGTEADESTVDDRSVFGPNLQGDGQKNRALFGEVHKTWGRWMVDAGLRYDDNDQFGGQTSPRAGVQYSFGRGMRIWGSYGEGYRAPSTGELFFPGSGNPELEPETAESFEIGLESQRERWLAGITAFQKDLTNLIDFDFVEFRNFNVGRARIQGVELKAGYQSQTWSLRWNGTYLDTEDRDTGLQLLRRPELASNLVATYASKRWTANLTGHYQGERDDFDPLTSERAVNDAYARVDVAAEWKANRFFSPYFRIENVTDEAYSEALGFPAPGVTLIGGVALRYR
ncbi:MAG: TonB-dependent receptor, partial [Acidobacteriota bacterium]